MDQSDLFEGVEEPGNRALNHVLENSSRLFVKRLTRNDVSAQSHQYGPLIPNEALFSDFFPELLESTEHEGVFEKIVSIGWHAGETVTTSRVVYYTSKGEGRITRLPAGEVIGGDAASFLVIGRPENDGGPDYLAVYIPIGSEAAHELEEVLSLGPEFHWDFLARPGRRAAEEADIAAVVAELTALLHEAPAGDWAGRFPVPSGVEIAEQSRAELCNAWEIDTLDPFRLERPGDFLHEVIKKTEFRIYRHHEKRHRVAAMLQLLARDLRNPTPEKVVAALFAEFDSLYDIMQGAAQARRARVGNSLENHVRTMLTEGSVPYAEQPLLVDSRRPDFILPSLKAYRSEASRMAREVLVLTLKTTLRERWMQIFHETEGCPIFLATLELSAPVSVLDSLGGRDVKLVVPESALALDAESNFLEKVDKHTTRRRNEVITFAEFFRDEVGGRLIAWQT